MAGPEAAVLVHPPFDQARAETLRAQASRLTANLGGGCCELAGVACGSCPVTLANRLQLSKPEAAVSEAETIAAGEQDKTPKTSDWGSFLWDRSEVTSESVAAQVRKSAEPSAAAQHTETVTRTAAEHITSVTTTEPQNNRTPGAQSQVANTNGQQRSAATGKIRNIEPQAVAAKNRQPENAELAAHEAERSRAREVVNQRTEAPAVTHDSQPKAVTKETKVDQAFVASTVEQASRIQQSAAPTRAPEKSLAVKPEATAAAPPDMPPPLRLVVPSAKKAIAPVQRVQPPKQPPKPKLKLVPKPVVPTVKANKPPATDKPIVATPKRPALKLVVAPSMPAIERPAAAHEPEAPVLQNERVIPHLRFAKDLPAVVPVAAESFGPIEQQADMSVTVKEASLGQVEAVDEKPVIGAIETTADESTPLVEINRSVITAADQAEIVNAMPQIVRVEARKPETGSEEMDEAITTELVEGAEAELVISSSDKKVRTTDENVRHLHAVPDLQGDISDNKSQANTGKEYTYDQIEARRGSNTATKTLQQTATNIVAVIGGSVLRLIRKAA